MSLTGPLPVRIVTGFLGSGKTTLVNHLLRQAMGSRRRVGVVVNEFGPISIDDRLIRRQSDDVIELSNGCVCCTMQRDLLETLSTLLSVGYELDSVVLETTGLADPGPLMASLMRPELAGLVSLDGVVTVVDCQHFDENLEQAEVAYQQLTTADVLLLNKADRVGDEVLDLIEQGVRRLNGQAVVMRCVHCAVDLDVLFGMGAPGHALAAAVEREGVDVERYGALGFALDGPLPRERFAVLAGGDLPVIRGKGILWCSDTDERIVFQRVGGDASFEPDGHWPGAVPPRTEVVLIGRDLDRDALLARVADALRADVRPL